MPLLNINQFLKPSIVKPPEFVTSLIESNRPPIRYYAHPIFHVQLQEHSRTFSNVHRLVIRLFPELSALEWNRVTSEHVIETGISIRK